MLKAKQMTRIHISGSKNVLEDTIKVLHNHQILHIMDYGNDLEAFEIGQPFEKASNLSKNIVDIRSIISYLKIKSDKEEKITDQAKAEERFHNIAVKFDSLVHEKDQLEAELKEIAETKEVFGPLSVLELPLKAYQGYETIRVFRGFIRSPFERELRKITQNYELYEGMYNKQNVFALFISKEYEQETLKILDKNGYIELPIPTSEVDLPSLKRTELRLSNRLEEVNKEFEKLKAESGEFLISYEKYLSYENEKAEAPLRFATSEHAFIIDGWVPSNDLNRIVEKLRKETQGKISIEAFKETDEAPVALNNPKTVEPFEFFMDLYSIPKYMEIDPTAIMFLTFPLFFGFMLGDIGYGIVTLALFYILSIKMKGEAKALLNALIVAAIATIIFGFVFGEFFGFQVIEHPIIHRVQDINTMMLISIAVGFVHVNLGYVFGFINTMKQHNIKEAIFENGSWMVIEAGLILFGAQYMGYLPLEAMYAGGAVTLIGIAMLIKGEGATGLIELPALLSNMLSYARLFAVGLASVSLALVVNEFATKFMHMGGLYIILAILILIVGHALNILLGILGPFLHSLRLHYVEFFTKFFKGGGTKYIPFGA